MHGRKKIDPQKVEDIMGLSPMQEGMLFHYLTDPESDQYFEQICFYLNGLLDVEACEKAWKYVGSINEMLRAIFIWEKLEKPIQIILKDFELIFHYFDFTKFTTEATRGCALAEFRKNDRKEKFDLAVGPLFRISIIKLTKISYVMVLSNHHIIYDGWSNGVILQEFFSAYHSYCLNEEPIKPQKTRFKEYLKWLKDQDRFRAEDYWRTYLKGFLKPTLLPVDTKKVAEITRIEHFTNKFPDELKIAIENFTKEQKVTLGAFFYTVWGILLQKYFNEEDVVFGITVSGRPTNLSGVENIVGLFINTIPLRIHCAGKEKVTSLITGVNHSVQASKEYENTPIVEIKAYSELSMQESLYDSIVAVENYPIQRESGQSGLILDSYDIFEMSNYDLLVEILTFQEFGLKLSYNPDIFQLTTMKRLAGHYLNIIKAILANLEVEVEAIEMLFPEEKAQILLAKKIEHDEGDFAF